MLARPCPARYLLIVTNETETSDDLNYFIVRSMIGLGAVAIVVGLVAIIVACFRTIP